MTDIFAVGIILWELLASRRLFTGENEAQIVHKVQAAKVPPISQINRNVPPELEAIVHRALARDRHDRYATARELGQDLSRFMFRFGQPVSGYDIATIVQATMRERENARLAQGSFIQKLIDEALFEFTSLREDRHDAAALSGMLIAARSDDAVFVDSASPAGMPEVEAGNLAALEEEAPAVHRYRRVVLALVVLLTMAAALAWFAH
jgi:serine/threonine-protein kinase